MTAQDSTQTQETDETQETETAPADETQETDSTSDDTTDTQTAAAATATGVAAPADSSAQDNETAVASADAQTTTPADSTSTAPADSTATAPADSTTAWHPLTQQSVAQAHTPDPDKLNGDTYDVVKGDCVWNIAKAHLKALHKDKTGYEPTDIEILNHTKELMDKNNLHYENDNCHVLIKPGDKLDIKAA